VSDLSSTSDSNLFEKITNGVVVSIEKEGISQRLLAFRRSKWALDAPCYVGEIMLRPRTLF
jgi:hypothetical protein